MTTLLVWLVVGIIAGVLAKQLIPNMDKSNWFFAAFICIVGAMTGGFAGELSGASQGFATEALVAVTGAMIVLFFFRQYLTDINAEAID